MAVFGGNVWEKMSRMPYTPSPAVTARCPNHSLSAASSPATKTSLKHRKIMIDGDEKPPNCYTAVKQQSGNLKQHKK